MDDGINGKTTGDGQQDTYDRALIQLVMTHFSLGEIPAMMQRAYLGDDVVPDWESSTPPGITTSRCPVHLIETRHADSTCWRCPQQLDSGTAEQDEQDNSRTAEPQEQAAGWTYRIPVRHQPEEIPAWRKALIRVLAAGIARLA